MDKQNIHLFSGVVVRIVRAGEFSLGHVHLVLTAPLTRRQQNIPEIVLNIDVHALTDSEILLIEYFVSAFLFTVVAILVQHKPLKINILSWIKHIKDGD